MKAKIPVWNINSLAEFFMQRFTKFKGIYEESCQDMVKLREDFSCEIQNLGFQVYTSQANFLMVKVPTAINGLDFCMKMLDHNILLKCLDNKKGINEYGYIRLAIRTESENKNFIRVARKVLLDFSKS